MYHFKKFWKKSFISIEPFTTNVPHHIKTSQLIFIANHLTGFYMIGNIGRSWVNQTHFYLLLFSITTASQSKENLTR